MTGIAGLIVKNAKKNFDIEMIGLVKKKKKKIKPGYKKKINGLSMKNVAKLSEQKVVPVDVQNVKLNAKHFKNKTVGPVGFTVFLIKYLGFL